MKFEIDMDKLRSAIVENKGGKTFVNIAEKIGMSKSAMYHMLYHKNRKITIPIYFTICQYLGVSAYHFMRIEGQSETIGTYDKLKNR